MCCCITIEVGGLIIALFDMIINLIGIAFSSTMLLYNVCFQFKCRTRVTDIITEEIHRRYQTNRDDDVDYILDSLFWSLILSFVLCVQQFGFNCILIHGIRKKDKEKVKLWLIFKACIVILGIFMILTQNSAGQGVYRQISEILYVFLTLFFMCIIFILYDVMNRRRHRVNSNRLVNSSYSS